jgi:hypothetical protein
VAAALAALQIGALVLICAACLVALVVAWLDDHSHEFR